MKKFFMLGAALCCGLLLTQSAIADDSTMKSVQPQAGAAEGFQRDASNKTFSQDGYYQSSKEDGQAGVYYHETYGQGQAQGGTSGAADSTCPADHPVGDVKTGDCWCMYAHYEPCYYNTWRCVEKPVYSCVKKCRYVPKYYEVQRCKYVPQYYTETKCEQVPEYYDEQVCTTCKEWVCDKQCKYVPKYYWKHTCGDTAPCETGCASGSCR